MNLFENAFNKLLTDNTVAGAFGPNAAVEGGNVPGSFKRTGNDERLAIPLGAKVVKKKCPTSKKKKCPKKMLNASKQIPIQTRFGLSGSDKPIYGSM